MHANKTKTIRITTQSWNLLKTCKEYSSEPHYATITKVCCFYKKNGGSK